MPHSAINWKIWHSLMFVTDYRILCDAGSDDFWGMNVPSGLLCVFNTKQIMADRLLLQMRTSFHCHREKQQGFTLLHSAVSHNGNEVGKHIYKWWLARWFYRTQADACGSRAIECFIRLAHRCWSPLPTYRISCDAGSDYLLGKMCHPVCSVSVTRFQIALGRKYGLYPDLFHDYKKI